jgi:TetR/AcrR family transcriptional regulator, transcriptional repressor for nem operon
MRIREACALRWESAAIRLKSTGDDVRYAPEHKEKTRARILAAAGKLFRRIGYHAAGVDKVMEEAGLTAGGFYAHFDSKQALLAEAIEHSRIESGERRAAWTGGRSGRDWAQAFLGGYLGRDHRHQIEEGCPLAALISEVSRADDSAKASFEAIVRELASTLASHVEECGPADAKERALAAVALCVGGLGLARSAQDEAFAERIIRSCRKHAMELLCPTEAGREQARTRGKAKKS